jgi:hypothetical protein
LGMLNFIFDSSFAEHGPALKLEFVIEPCCRRDGSPESSQPGNSSEVRIAANLLANPAPFNRNLEKARFQKNSEKWSDH